MGCHGHRRRTQVQAAPVERTDTRPELRVSDADRDRVVEDLRAHGADGRLTVEELAERTGRALAARTRSDLDALTADLPRPPRRRDPARERRELHEHVRSYLAVMALLVAIWAFTGADHFWPVWPMLGWGIGVLSHAGSVRPLLRSGAGTPRAAIR